MLDRKTPPGQRRRRRRSTPKASPRSVLGLASLFVASLTLSSCGDDDGPRFQAPPNDDTAAQPDAAMTSTAEDAGTRGDAGESDSVYAINETFDDWDGGEGRDFSVTKGENADQYPEHNTIKQIDGQDCLWIEADAVDNNGYGFSVEVEFALDQQTDMSGEDYEISYDLYVPPETYALGANTQFGFYTLPDYEPIYSQWYSGSIHEGEWSTISATIDNSSGNIDYSALQNNPGDWVFDTVRIQLIINGSSATLGSQVAFCLDNLQVRQVEKSSEEEEGPIASEGPSPYAVWVDGEPVRVVRLDKLEVPVNYARYDHPGHEVEVRVASSNGLDGVTVSPHSKNIPVDVGVNVMTLQVDDPSYLIVDVPDGERLFLLLDPAEQDAPKPDDANVRNVVDEGADNTASEEATEILQAAIDAASGDDRNIVYVPPGAYLTRTLYLRDDMTLYLAEGAVLWNATPQGDLVAMQDDLAVIEGSSLGLIVANGVKNAKLKGRGTIDGNGARLQRASRKMFLVKVEDSENIEIDGIISRDSAFWNTLIYRSREVHITNYKVINNQLASEWNETDGVDFDNSADSSLVNAFLYTGDDCMAVKSDDIQDDLDIQGLLDPTEGEYINVSNLLHSGVVCHSASSGCKIGTKTFGETVSQVQFVDVDIVRAERGLVIDAVDTATIDETLFEDIRMEDIRGRLVDFNMDPEAIEWRTNPGISTVTNTTVRNVIAANPGAARIKGNIHDWNPNDPYYEEEYFIDGVHFEDFVVDRTYVLSLDSDVVDFDVNDYAINITFDQTGDGPSFEDGGAGDGDAGVDPGPDPGPGDAGVGDGGTAQLEWLPSWATTIQRTEDRNEPPPLADTTLRQFIWPSYSGSEVRIQLSNERGDGPVEITKVHLARALPLGNGEIDPDTDTAFTWDGDTSITIPAGETAWSDPVAFDFVALQPFAVSMHFETAPADVTGHPGARTTSYVAEGDVVSEGAISGETRDRWYFINAVEVMAPSDAQALAVLGDSITDGYGVLNEFARWPDFLNRRITQTPATAGQVSVLNFGMGGNCLTAPGENGDMDPGIVRFERDVLGRKDKIGWLLVVIGVNDIIYCNASATAITDAYQDIIDRSHAEGILVYGATITPFEGHTQGEALEVRDDVNHWIRTSGEFDAVIDFDWALADPWAPSFLHPALSNDGLHPNLAGYEALAYAVDLSLFDATQ